MYKIFINNRPLILAGYSDKVVYGPDTLYVDCDSENTFDTVFQLAQNEPVFFKTTWLAGGNADELMGLLLSRCKLIEAAGGLVKNDKGELLMIFRNGLWDLPKGKIESGEDEKTAAIREVEEECGISGLTIMRSLTPTFHTYRHHDKTILKKTYWFEMHCTDTRPLVPQTKEGITEVRWMDSVGVEKAMENTFLSIAEVVRL
jgi:ADP-ribose pyrophosphatase YjhB (NUDIX family)